MTVVERIRSRFGRSAEDWLIEADYCLNLLSSHIHIEVGILV